MYAEATPPERHIRDKIPHAHQGHSLNNSISTMNPTPKRQRENMPLVTPDHILTRMFASMPAHSEHHLSPCIKGSFKTAGEGLPRTWCRNGARGAVLAGVQLGGVFLRIQTVEDGSDERAEVLARRRSILVAVRGVGRGVACRPNDTSYCGRTARSQAGVRIGIGGGPRGDDRAVRRIQAQPGLADDGHRQELAGAGCALAPLAARRAGSGPGSNRSNRCGASAGRGRILVYCVLWLE